MHLRIRYIRPHKGQYGSDHQELHLSENNQERSLERLLEQLLRLLASKNVFLVEVFGANRSPPWEFVMMNWTWDIDGFCRRFCRCSNLTRFATSSGP
jgi:hypothetical protein